MSRVFLITPKLVDHETEKNATTIVRKLGLSSRLPLESTESCQSGGEHFKAIRNLGGKVLDPLGLASGPFRIVPEAFLRVARANRPTSPKATVSGFSSWVHSLYAPPTNPINLQVGRESEKLIFDRRRKILSQNAGFWRSDGPNWVLIHNGLMTAEDNTSRLTAFEIPQLTVRGHPVLGCPDLIYQNKKTRQIYLVEIKFSRQPIPSNLWPDIWAQLWAYAQIPECLAAPEVATVGEIWGDHSRQDERNLSISEYEALGSEELFLRKLLRRNPRSAAFDRFFRELFDIYTSGSSHR